MQGDPSQILLMASSMFVVTFLIGYLPTKLSAPERVMNLLALFGAGLLVGAALIVIVPEGMSVLYASQLESQGKIESEVVNRYVGASLVFGFIVMLLIDQGFKVIQENFHTHSHAKERVGQKLNTRERNDEEIWTKQSDAVQRTPPSSSEERECEPLTRDKTQEDDGGYDTMSDKYSFKVIDH